MRLQTRQSKLLKPAHGVTILKNEQSNWPAGVKKTKQRKSILDVLENSDIPLSAADICAKMDSGGNTAWLSTVYRTLELFVKKGLVIKTNITNREMALYELNHFGHRHYAVCMGCRKIIAISNCPLENFIPNLEEEGFHVTGHNLEIFGFCRNCKPFRSEEQVLV